MAFLDAFVIENPTFEFSTSVERINTPPVGMMEFSCVEITPARAFYDLVEFSEVYTGNPADLPGMSEDPCIGFCLFGIEHIPGDTMVEIRSGLGVDFSATPLRGRYPLTVQFTSDLQREVQTYFWEFGDGQTSTEKNPTHTYDTYGTYPVSLTVTYYEIRPKVIKRNYILVFADDSYVITKDGQYNGAGNETKFRSLQGKFKLKVTAQGTIQLLWGEQGGEYTQFLEVPSSATDIQKTNFKFFLEQQSDYQEANVDDIVICKGAVS